MTKPANVARTWHALLACAAISAGSLTELRSQRFYVDLGLQPNGQVTAPNAVISTEWRSLGVLFSARRANEPLLQQGSVWPIAAGSGANRFLFFTPDVYGAVGIFRFVVPGTATPTDATALEIYADFDAPYERVELVGFDSSGIEVTRMNLSSPGFGSYPVRIQGRFAQAEIRTFGNPGIGLSGGRRICYDLFYAPYGAGCRGAGGTIPTIEGVGSAVGGGSILLRVSNGPANGGFLIAMGTTPGTARILGCDLLLGNIVGNTNLLQLSPAGSYDFAIPVPTALARLPLYFQAYMADAGAPNALFSATAGLAAVPQ